MSPMNVTKELEFYSNDCQAKVAIVGQELFERIAPLQQGTFLKHVIIAAYSDYISLDFDLEIPPEVRLSPPDFSDNPVIHWRDAVSAGLKPGPLIVAQHDLAVLPYTSGTTGRPKGCVHTHETVNTNTVSAAAWGSMTANTISLVTLPLFHVTGMQHSMNAPIFSGGTMVLLTRWNRDLAALVCVIGVSDSKRGETVKAFVILHEKDRGKVKEQEIIDWSKERMSSYKYPRIVQFVESLPMSASGKVLWRELQEQAKVKKQ